MPVMQRLSLALLFLVVAAGTAAAQNEPADRVHDPLTMDRLTPVSTLNLDFGYEIWDDDLFYDQVIGLTIAGHFVSTTGLGGYVVLPLSFITTQDNAFGGDESDAILGNLELGGLYAKPLGRDADLVLHGGLALPTANDDFGGGELDLFQAVASVPRWGDLVDRVPNTTWLRLGVSPMGRASMFFWRADVGLDLMLDDDDNTGVDISPVIRVNVGGGVDLGTIDLMAELDTNIVDDDSNDDDDSASTLALGGRFGAGNVQPGLGLIVPLGFDNLENLEFVVLASMAIRL